MRCAIHKNEQKGNIKKIQRMEKEREREEEENRGQFFLLPIIGTLASVKRTKYRRINTANVFSYV